MSIHISNAACLSSDATQYQQVCQTPCVLTRTGKLRTQRLLIPWPPLSLVPLYVLALYESKFGGAPAPVDVTQVSLWPSITPQQLYLLRRYGLVTGYRGRLGKSASATARIARSTALRHGQRQYMSHWRRKAHVRQAAKRYAKQWFQVKKQDRAWYANHLAKNRTRRQQARHTLNAFTSKWQPAHSVIFESLKNH